MSTELINRVVELTNIERANAGLQPLTLDLQLADAAQDHSNDMAQDDFFNHTGVDGSTVGSRVTDTGYQYSTVGENIAAGQTTAEQVVEGWMNSPGHRANILNANFTEIGIGYKYLANDTGSVNLNHYWTQVFGTPLSGNSGGSNSQPPTQEIVEPAPVEEVVESAPVEEVVEPTPVEEVVESTPVEEGESSDNLGATGSAPGTELINQVVELTNIERANAGLQPLTLDLQLVDAAQDHSGDMAQDDFFSHTGADGSTVGSRVTDTGYQYSTVGENIAAGQTTAAEVVEGWMNSDGHRANILNANFTEIGIGYEYLENDTGSVNYNHYWTQVFGTPLNGNSGGSSSQPPTEEIAEPAHTGDISGVSHDSVVAGDHDVIEYLEEKFDLQNTSHNLSEDCQLEIESWLGMAAEANGDSEIIELVEAGLSSHLAECNHDFAPETSDSI